MSQQEASGAPHPQYLLFAADGKTMRAGERTDLGRNPNNEVVERRQCGDGPGGHKFTRRALRARKMEEGKGEE